MNEETVILCREEGLDHAVGDLLETDRRAPHLAELPHQEAVAAVDAQGFLVPYVPQYLYGREPGRQVQVGARHRHQSEGHDRESSDGQTAEEHYTWTHTGR